MPDINAIHVNAAGEIAGIAEKAVPVNADLVVIEDSAAANAKKRVQLGNLPGGGGGGLGYSLQFDATPSGYSPADGQTIFWGHQGAAPELAGGRCRVYIPKSGTIKVADIFSYASVAGSDEAWPAYVRLNDTTDTLIQSLGVATADRHWRNTGLAIGVAAGDFVEIKMVNPAWVTNPNSLKMSGSIYIE